MIIALKKNKETPESTAKMYLSQWENGRFVWQTMDRGRMVTLFQSFLDSGTVKAETKQKILVVLAENFV